MRIENWFPRPHNGHVHIVGAIFGHDRIPDGETFTTSRVVSVRPGTLVVWTKSNHKYRLGSAAKGPNPCEGLRIDAPGCVVTGFYLDGQD